VKIRKKRIKYPADGNLAPADYRWLWDRFDDLKDCDTDTKERVGKLEATSSWHTWAIRLLIGGMITVGGVGGYAALG